MGMEITLNNQQKKIIEHCSVQQLLNEVVPEKQNGIAVAVNLAVVAKINWQNYVLKQHDEVLIIKASQGG